MHKHLFLFLLILFFSITPATKTKAQTNWLFDDLKAGKWEMLERYIDSMGVSVNARNRDGYTPLHWLIKHYIDHDPNKYFGNEKAYAKNVAESENYRKCLQILLKKKPNLQDKTPEGWNALQYAIVSGKWGPTDKILDVDENKKILDNEGNTLLHLSVLADKETTIEKFWYYLHDRVLSDKVSVKTPNFAGQTPIAFYLSLSRKLTSKSFKILEALRYPSAINVKDLSGKSALDYAKEKNSWAVYDLESYLKTAAIVQKDHEEFMKKFNQQIKDNQRLLEEYNKNNASGAKLLTSSFTVTYSHQCNVNNKGKVYGSKLSDPVIVTVTPDKVTISSLEPYYGSFIVEKSGEELIDGKAVWEVYYFKQTSTNSTYKAIGFPKGDINRPRAMIKTNLGTDGLCKY